MAYRVVAVPMILRIECSLRLLTYCKPFQMCFSQSCAEVDKISADMVSWMVSQFNGPFVIADLLVFVLAMNNQVLVSEYLDKYIR